jgi:Leucine-rich repeat (LRR) protein
LFSRFESISADFFKFGFFVLSFRFVFNRSGLHTLIPILSQTPISTLNLSQNQLTDASASVLAQETTSNHRLISVNVSFNAVSAAIMESIQASCQVCYSHLFDLSRVCCLNH